MPKNNNKCTGPRNVLCKISRVFETRIAIYLPRASYVADTYKVTHPHQITYFRQVT